MVGGGIWPVVHRELRSAARRPASHWFRVAGALGGVCVFCLAAWNAPITSVGGQIFLGAHRLLMVLILCIVPAITADCIARERREGTLGLLFLTPLRSWEIVIGKVLVQVLTALTLWLAVVPVLTIPFLTGGVAWRGVVSQLGTELCAGIFCLAAGIVASSLTDKRATAFTLAFAFAAALVFGLTEERWWNLLRGIPGATSRAFVTQNMITVTRTHTTYYYITSRPSPPAFSVISFLPLAGRFLFALLVLWGAIRFAGFCVERSWKDKAPSVSRTNWSKFCGAPVFQKRFECQMRRTLEWNPIAWLQQYSWKARLTKWGLCLAFTGLICMASTARNFNGIADREPVVLAVLAAAYTYAGVNGFLQEKKNGALELILVTPLTIDEIIFGRVWGLWKQFFPAAFVLAACFFGLRWIWHYEGPGYGGLNFYSNRYGVSHLVYYFLTDEPLREFTFIIGFIIGFFTLPVYATLAALRFTNIVWAAALTWLSLLGASLAGILVSGQLLNANGDPGWIYVGVLAGNVVFVTLAFGNLRRSLAQRDYSF